MNKPPATFRHPLRLAFAGVAVAVLAPATALATPPSSLYKLRPLEGRFSGSTVDTSRWNFRTDVKALSAQLAANAVIDNGQLSLLMKQQSVSGKSYTGGGVISKQLFGYGYFEVRAKNTTNTGWHNSFWMMAGDGSDTFTAGRYLEIDQAEIDTADQTHIPSGLQIWNGQAGSGANIGGPRCATYAPHANLTAAYHTYGADWREGAIDFYLDGVKYFTIAYSTTQYRQDPVNIWLTAIAYRTPVSVGGTPQYYDTARFYKRDQYVINGRYGYSESGLGWADSTLAGFGLLPQRYSCTAGAKGDLCAGLQPIGRLPRLYLEDRQRERRYRRGSAGAGGVRQHHPDDQLRHRHVRLARSRRAHVQRGHNQPRDRSRQHGAFGLPARGRGEVRPRLAMARIGWIASLAGLALAGLAIAFAVTPAARTEPTEPRIMVVPSAAVAKSPPAPRPIRLLRCPRRRRLRTGAIHRPRAIPGSGQLCRSRRAAGDLVRVFP